MIFRMLLVGVSLAACAPRPDPMPPVHLTGPAADTSFKGNARDVVDQVALSQHNTNIQ